MACDLAQQQNPRLFRDPKFILRFLRAAAYDSGDCAKRLVSYFEQKKKLFGTEKLCEPLSEDDLDVDDKKCLESGIMQVLPARDRAGRAILFWNVCLRESHSHLSQQRVQFYVLEMASKPMQTQHRGMIIVSWNYGRQKMSLAEMESSLCTSNFMTMHQVRCEAFHVCLDPEDDFTVLPTFTKLSATHAGIVFRAHQGNVLEIQESLKKYGVPVHQLPLPAVIDRQPDVYHSRIGEATPKKSRIEGSLSKRKQENPTKRTPTTNTTTQEYHLAPTGSELLRTSKPTTYAKGGSSNTTSSNCTSLDQSFELTDRDVVLGKGRRIQNLLGNIRFRDLIKERFDDYERAENHQEKTLEAMRVVADIKQNGGKFLKEEPAESGRYVLVSADVAREKVSSAFHSYRSHCKRTNRTSTMMLNCNPANKYTGENALNAKEKHFSAPNSAPGYMQSMTHRVHEELPSSIRKPFETSAEWMKGTRNVVSMMQESRASTNPLFKVKDVREEFEAQTHAWRSLGRWPMTRNPRLTLSTDSLPMHMYDQLFPGRSLGQQEAPLSRVPVPSVNVSQTGPTSLQNVTRFYSAARRGSVPTSVSTTKDQKVDDGSSVSPTRFAAQEKLQSELYREMGLPGY